MIMMNDDNDDEWWQWWMMIIMLMMTVEWRIVNYDNDELPQSSKYGGQLGNVSTFGLLPLEVISFV